MDKEFVLILSDGTDMDTKVFDFEHEVADYYFENYGDKKHAILQVKKDGQIIENCTDAKVKEFMLVHAGMNLKRRIWDAEPREEVPIKPGTRRFVVEIALSAGLDIAEEQVYMPSEEGEDTLETIKRAVRQELFLAIVNDAGSKIYDAIIGAAEDLDGGAGRAIDVLRKHFNPIKDAFQLYKD